MISHRGFLSSQHITIVAVHLTELGWLDEGRRGGHTLSAPTAGFLVWRGHHLLSVASSYEDAILQADKKARELGLEVRDRVVE